MFILSAVLLFAAIYQALAFILLLLPVLLLLYTKFSLNLPLWSFDQVQSVVNLALNLSLMMMYVFARRVVVLQKLELPKFKVWSGVALVFTAVHLALAEIAPPFFGEELIVDGAFPEGSFYSTLVSIYNSRFIAYSVVNFISSTGNLFFTVLVIALVSAWNQRGRVVEIRGVAGE